MDDYKEVTSATEGRLFLSTKKVHEADGSDGYYFQSRPEVRPTVELRLSPIAATILADLPSKSKASSTGNAHNEAKNGAKQDSLPAHTRSSGKKLRKTDPKAVETPPSTSNNAFTLSLELAEPILYMEGFEYPHTNVHRSAVLRGFMRLNVIKKTDMSEVSLDFRGVSQTVWPEAWRVRHLKKVYQEDILRHSWNFLTGDRASTLNKLAKTGTRSFDPGVYTYSFELPLASSLPETVDLPLGTVYYTLTAAAASESGRHSSDSATVTCTETVTLARIPCTCSLETTEPYEVHGTLHGMRYQFALAAKSFPIGGKAPLSIKLWSSQDRSFQHISVSMVEDVQYRTRDGLAHREQSRCREALFTKRLAARDPLHQRAFRRISAAGDKMSSSYAHGAVIEKLPRISEGSLSRCSSNDAEYLQEKVILNLPSCSRIHADTAYSCMYVRHYLLVSERPTTSCGMCERLSV